MAPKKKTGGKKKKATYTPSSNFVFEPPSATELGSHPSEFVRCRICSTELSHLNFEWPAVPTELTLSTVRTAIRQRHGNTLNRLSMYRDKVLPENNLTDQSDSATLKDLGIRGASTLGDAEVLPVVTFLYDFAAARSDDSILTVEPHTLSTRRPMDLKAFGQIMLGCRH